MLHSGATTLDDCRRRGRIMLEIGCVKCPRYSSHRLDQLIAMCGPYYSLDQPATFMSWDCPKAPRRVGRRPCGARCLNAQSGDDAVALAVPTAQRGAAAAGYRRLLHQASADIRAARNAFRLHISLDPAWRDLDEDERDRIIDWLHLDAAPPVATRRGLVPSLR